MGRENDCLRPRLERTRRVLYRPGLPGGRLEGGREIDGTGWSTVWANSSDRQLSLGQRNRVIAGEFSTAVKTCLS